MSSEFAIRAVGLGKTYQIYPTPRDRLKQFVMPRLRSTFGFKPRQYFQDFSALDGVSFEVRRGETFGIIGRNGSGKSTLLQILCGTLTPTEGTVEVNGRVAALLELGAGFNPEFTGRENVFMNARVLGLTEEKIQERFASIVAFSEIADFIDRPVKTYSSGMYVRLAFAVIAHVDADILVIDEALSVGDAFFVQKCMRYLREFMDRGTLLFVSHDTGSVLNLCSRAMLLKQGRPICLDTPKVVVQQYLEGLVEANQGAIVVNAGDVAAEPLEASDDDRDMRQDLFNASNLRNDVEIFRFNERSSAFGTGLANVSDVRLLSTDATPLAWALGGENVSLRIRCTATKPIDSPIVGFQLLDRIGQPLFGDNTYLTHRGQTPSMAEGESIEANFEFRLPLLPPGDYSFCVAVAEGTQENHVQHHWMHDALIIRVHSDSGVHGLVGIPMQKIELRALAA